MHLRAGWQEPGHDTELRHGLYVEPHRAVVVPVLPSAQGEPGLRFCGPNGGRLHGGGQREVDEGGVPVL